MNEMQEESTMSEYELAVFSNSEFGEVRIITQENGVPLFCGSDVAKALGYQNPSRDIQRHCKTIQEKRTTDLVGRQQAMLFIPESDLYRLVFRSKLPSAERFTDWVTSEVLPTIRKTGGYVANDDLFLATYLPTADESTKLFFKATLTTMRKLSKASLPEWDENRRQPALCTSPR